MDIFAMGIAVMFLVACFIGLVFLILQGLVRTIFTVVQFRDVMGGWWEDRRERRFERRRWR